MEIMEIEIVHCINWDLLLDIYKGTVEIKKSINTEYNPQSSLCINKIHPWYVLQFNQFETISFTGVISLIELPHYYHKSSVTVLGDCHALRTNLSTVQIRFKQKLTRLFHLILFNLWIFWNLAFHTTVPSHNCAVPHHRALSCTGLWITFICTCKTCCLLLVENGGLI